MSDVEDKPCYTITVNEKDEVYKGCDICSHVKETPPFIDIDFIIIPRYFCRKLGISVEQDFYCKHYERK